MGENGGIINDLNERQRRFLELYRSGMDPEEAAKDAGYKRLGAASALLGKLCGQGVELKADRPSAVADPTEILQMLTSVMRGDVHDPVVVVEQRTGKEGKTERCARVINKSASVKERMSAAEMLARRYGIFNGEGDDHDSVIFVGEEKFLADITEETDSDEED